MAIEAARVQDRLAWIAKDLTLRKAEFPAEVAESSYDSRKSRYYFS